MTDSWKLLIYPIAIIMLLGLLINAVVTPLIEEEVIVEQYPNAVNSILQNVVAYGLPFNISFNYSILGFNINLPVVSNPVYQLLMPNDFQDFILNQLTAFLYIPLYIQIPLLIILTLSIGYATYTLITLLIP